MSRRTDRGPSPADLLYRNLFEHQPPERSFELISEGLAASYRNADRLLSDARYLLSGGRLSSARFMLATAREEIAKSYILVDACRLDLKRHDAVLRRLCRAFYDHISKHAYLEVLKFPNLRSLAEAKEIWFLETKRWWPAGSPDTGEPDMPHDTCFDREFPLYIDYGNYERRWMIPQDSDQNAYFMRTFCETPISRTEKTVQSWREANLAGVSAPIVLSSLNEVFSHHYFRVGASKANDDELLGLYTFVAERVAAATNISKEVVLASPLVQWPLYDFV